MEGRGREKGREGRLGGGGEAPQQLSRMFHTLSSPKCMTSPAKVSVGELDYGLRPDEGLDENGPVAAQHMEVVVVGPCSSLGSGSTLMRDEVALSLKEQVCSL